MAVSISSLAAAARVLGRHASTLQPDRGAAALAAGGRGWRFLGATEHSRAAGFMERADQASPSIGKERERENRFCVSIKNQAEAAVELATALKSNLIGVGLSLPATNLLLSPKPAVQLQHRRTFIQLKTNLEVADNSGAKRVQCIKVLRGGKGARPGDTIIASVKDAVPRGKVKKGDVVYCIVVRAALQKLRCDGSEIKFDGNAVVLVNKQLEPIGTRVFGPISAELRQRKLDKVLALAEHIA